MFKHTKLKSAILPLLVLFLTLASCEDYLEEQPSTVIDSDYIFTTEEGLKSGVVSLYKFYRDRYDNSTEDFMGAVLMSCKADLTFARSGYTGLMGRYERGVSTDDRGTNVVSELFYRNFYNITNKATAIINAAEVIEGIDAETRNQIIAEAKFFRAHSYFYLFRMYGNVYISEETITLDNAFDVISDKTPDDQVFELINNDLEFAIENLKWVDVFGRVTKGTAKHEKAKVAMWQGDYIEARDQAISVIEDPNSPHALLQNTEDVFGGDKNHSESLFVIQARDGLLGGGGVTMMNANYVTQYFQIRTDADGNKVEPTVEMGGQGFSRILPNRYLLGLLEQDPNDNRSTTYFQQDYFYTGGPRVGEVIDAYERIEDPANPPPLSSVRNYYRFIHPSCMKFFEEDQDLNTYRVHSNIMVYRLAETYLIAAEAIMRSSGNPLPYINAIRERAGAAPLTFVDQQTILDERARELAFEGQRFFTLKRMGQDVIDFQMTTYSGDGDFFPNNQGGSRDPRANWKSHFINMPIAQRDLDLLGDTYPGVPGY